MRALRKMLAKLARVRQKAAKGEHERIVARQIEVELNATATGLSETGKARPRAQRTQFCTAFGNKEHPSLQSLQASLNNEQSLEAASEAIHFLKSVRLHYCTNCDEQWPVFDAPWPQTGVLWTG